jgi:hypothetical protein
VGPIPDDPRDAETLAMSEARTRIEADEVGDPESIHAALVEQFRRDITER